MRTIPQTRPGEVLVQCVWPATRGAKPDCRGDTGVVWAGHGDVKAYPADKWHLLADHPDVWRLFDPATMSVPAGNGAANVQAPLQLQQHQATKLERDQAALLRRAMERIRELEEMVATLRQSKPADPAAPEDAQEQQGLDERVELAASRNTDLVEVVIDDATDTAETGQAKFAAVAAHEKLKAPAITLSLDDLKAMSVEEVRQLAVARDYGFSPRLLPEKLYSKFLEMQALRSEKKA